MKLNSAPVQWVLKVAMSKSGPYIAAGASWFAVHVLTWTHAANFLPAPAAEKIQGGLEHGATEIGLALVATAYAWVVNRQAKANTIAKAMIDLAPTPTPAMDMRNPALGNTTLDGLSKVTGVSIEDAAAHAGMEIKRALPVN